MCQEKTYYLFKPGIETESISKEVDMILSINIFTS